MNDTLKKPLIRTRSRAFFPFQHLIYYNSCTPIHQEIAATNADAGIVNTQAQTIFPATPHLTADIFCAEPTPTIEPVMVCVVDTGIPERFANNKVNAPALSAQKPPTGFSFVIF